MNKVMAFVSETLIKLVEENGMLPWRKPWKAQDQHQGYASGHVYRGTNRVLTTWTALARGFTSPYWLTLKQVLAHGGRVRKEEYRRSTPVVLWGPTVFKKTLPDGTEETRSFMQMKRFYPVYNVDQCENIAPPARAKTSPLLFSPVDRAEEIIRNMPNAPKIIHGASAAFYRPSEDTVYMPDKSTFTSVGEYYSTLYHEAAGHASGHKSRLARKNQQEICKFGDENYGLDELISEITSSFLCAEAGLQNETLSNNAAYLASWLRTLKAEPKMLITAAQAAEKACDYVLGRTFESKDEPAGDGSTDEVEKAA